MSAHRKAAPWLDSSLAPNGRAVRENFATWFADSAVVGPDGTPLVVYHGTTASSAIATFKGLGWPGWFSEDCKLAHRYAMDDSEWYGEDSALYPAFLCIRKPLVLDFDMNDEPSAAENVLKALGFAPDWKAWEVHELVDTKPFMEAVRVGGYDGVRVKEDGRWTWAPACSGQIKSAIGNNGNYDPTASCIADTATAPQPRIKAPGLAP